MLCFTRFRGDWVLHGSHLGVSMLTARLTSPCHLLIFFRALCLLPIIKQFSVVNITLNDNYIHREEPRVLAHLPSCYQAFGHFTEKMEDMKKTLGHFTVSLLVYLMKKCSYFTDCGDIHIHIEDPHCFAHLFFSFVTLFVTELTGKIEFPKKSYKRYKRTF